MDKHPADIDPNIHPPRLSAYSEKTARLERNALRYNRALIVFRAILRVVDLASSYKSPAIAYF